MTFLLRESSTCNQWLYSVLVSVSGPTHCAVQRAVDFQSSGWLTVLPKYHFDLSPLDYHDALSLHYYRLLLLLVMIVVGLLHALNCHQDGLVTRHHNEVKNAHGDLASFAYKDGVREPVVCEGYCCFDS